MPASRSASRWSPVPQLRQRTRRFVCARRQNLRGLTAPALSTATACSAPLLAAAPRTEQAAILSPRQTVTSPQTGLRREGLEYFLPSSQGSICDCCENGWVPAGETLLGTTEALPSTTKGQCNRLSAPIARLMSPRRNSAQPLNTPLLGQRLQTAEDRGRTRTGARRRIASSASSHSLRIQERG